jgi:prepilin peptidase CpaA
LIDTHSVLVAIWTITLIAAAAYDLRAFRIPNFLPGILILLFGVMTALHGLSPEIWENFFHFLLALVVGMALFSRGWIGGGDAKLYAAAALWFRWEEAVPFLFLTTLAGLLLAIAFIVARMAGLRKNVPKQDRRIPYGVAIAAGAILSAAWSGWGVIFPGLN